MSDYVQLVGSDTPGCVGSCCLVADDKRFLFNCPEGTQRHFSEARLRVSKTSQFMFTRVSVDTMMGLPGFLFTINDCGIRTSLFGGPLVQLDRFLRCTWRSFYGYRNMIAELVDYSISDELREGASISESFGLERALMLEKRCIFRGGRVPRTADDNSAKPSRPEPSTKRRPMNDGAVSEDAPQSEIDPVIMSSSLNDKLGTPLFRVSTAASDIIAFHAGWERRGSTGEKARPLVGYCIIERAKSIFHVQRAKELGVRPGPKFAKLKAGEDVLNDADPPVLIRARDVTCAPRQLSVSLVLDCDDALELAAATSSVFALVLQPYAERCVLQSGNDGGSCSLDLVLRHVFHLSRSDVAQSSEYRDTLGNADWWASQICCVPSPLVVISVASANHIYYHEAARDGTAFPTAMVHRLHLAALAPKFFPVATAPVSEVRAPSNPQHGGWSYQAKFHLFAQSPVAAAAPKKPSPQDQQEVTKYPTLEAAIQMLSPAFREQFLAPSCLEDIATPAAATADLRDGAVTFLGTGSSVPSKYRNVSGILVTLPSTTNAGQHSPTTRVVLDCGEGTLGQLHAWYCLGPQASVARDNYGENMTAFVECLASIDLIFISHSHADHNLGLLSLLHSIHRARQVSKSTMDSDERVQRNSLTIVGPKDFMDYVIALDLIDFASLERDCGLRIDTFSSSGPMRSSCPARLVGRIVPESPAITTPDGDEELAASESTSCQRQYDALVDWCTFHEFAAEVFPVDHPAHAHGFVMRSKIDPSFSVLYSGDCRPTLGLIQRGKLFGPLKLLIHEATFDDALQEEAVAKRHSTTGEAIGVSVACGARHLVLTHFSQRYPKLPPPSASVSVSNCETDSRLNHCDVMFSFDYMMIPLEPCALQLLPTLTNTFLALLAEYDSWESGTSKRMRE